MELVRYYLTNSIQDKSPNPNFIYSRLLWYKNIRTSKLNNLYIVCFVQDLKSRY